MNKLGLVGCTLAMLAASSTASAQFRDCTSARNSGFNLTEFYVSAVMNTIGCDGDSQRLEEGEALLQRLLGRFSLPESMPRDFKVCYASGFHEGYQSALLSEYRECRSVPSAESIGAAGGAVLSFALSELGDEISDDELSAIFEEGIVVRLRESQVDCRSRFLEVSGVTTVSRASLTAAALVCGES